MGKAPLIIEIPSAEDFKRASIHLLNLAWHIAIESLKAYNHSEVIHPADTPVQRVVMDDGTIETFGGPDTTWTPEERTKAAQEYWRRSQPSLGNALALIQQATEMGLKGRIAEVSPFLLILRDARDFPKGSTTKDVAFSAFRTLDAADLMRVHNSVCRERLSEKFNTFWEELRRKRNVVIHSVVASGDLIRPEQLIEQILTVHANLHPDQRWFQRHLEHVSNDEMEAAFSSQPKLVYANVLEAVDLVFHYLPPKLLREHFGYERRARSYVCVHCMTDCDDEAWHNWGLGQYAQLQPNAPTSATLRCGACGRTSKVLRVHCPDPKCRSTVLSDEEGHGRMCLVCSEEWDDEHLQQKAEATE